MCLVYHLYYTKLDKWFVWLTPLWIANTKRAPLQCNNDASIGRIASTVRWTSHNQGFGEARTSWLTVMYEALQICLQEYDITGGTQPQVGSNIPTLLATFSMLYKLYKNQNKYFQEKTRHYYYKSPLNMIVEFQGNCSIIHNIFQGPTMLNSCIPPELPIHRTHSHIPLCLSVNFNKNQFVRQ